MIPAFNREKSHKNIKNIIINIKYPEKLTEIDKVETLVICGSSTEQG
ncbi:hypothetical protein Arcpr_1209 [Archaeoglobus profundus DSM 5631]|uniref:Uncharacterized protein n=1 Tax=Archaeoglobus profundus (strain DSM 5631 / JCM 9629 / NBRC 100127 / Av18) TaxID=572546 RepID=D2RDR7_ARCPA|nr:hypothetical protein Arcpr_1209 [Archaeoglobus profundus DSM 5631]